MPCPARPLAPWAGTRGSRRSGRRAWLTGERPLELSRSTSDVHLALNWRKDRGVAVPTLSFTGSARRSPVEIVATMGTRLTRSPAAEMSGLRTGRFGRWADGVNAMRADCATFAGYWREHNDRVLTEHKPGPLWVVLGDSTAQGLGAPSPACGYVGQSLAALRRRTGQPWRVLNLSVSGSLTR